MTPDYLFVSGNCGVSNEKESFGVWSTLDTDDVSTRSKNGYRAVRRRWFNKALTALVGRLCLCVAKVGK